MMNFRDPYKAVNFLTLLNGVGYVRMFGGVDERLLIVQLQKRQVSSWGRPA
jgi:hypothetical protein